MDTFGRCRCSRQVCAHCSSTCNIEGSVQAPKCHSNILRAATADSLRWETKPYSVMYEFEVNWGNLQKRVVHQRHGGKTPELIFLTSGIKLQNASNFLCETTPKKHLKECVLRTIAENLLANGIRLRASPTCAVTFYDNA